MLRRIPGLIELAGLSLLLMMIVSPAATMAQMGRGNSINGIFALAPPNRPIPEQIYANPNVDGVSIQYIWMAIEPSDGFYNWGPIDDAIRQAQAHNKKVSLNITPAIFTPQWVYGAGARRFTFLWDKPWGFPPCSTQGFPIPWDETYQAKWTAFVRAVGARYSGNPALVLVKIQGINGQTSELLLPHTMPGGNQYGRLVQECPQQNDDNQTWVSAGYRPSKILSAWKNDAATYGQVFPNQHLVIEIGPWGFPPIDENGNLLQGRMADTHLPMEIVNTGREMFDGRFVVQNDGLNAVWAPPMLTQLATVVPIAFQTAWFVTNDPKCRMNHFQQPCDAQQMMQSTVNRGIESGAKYIEIYGNDVMNPQLQGILAEAHRRLDSQ
ncbi:MAG TPA: beta-galactosidase [Candidatus Binataceae bacterium]|nr:beta-galactosidase [Candidatus Binataceae bacterium]